MNGRLFRPDFYLLVVLVIGLTGCSDGDPTVENKIVEAVDRTWTSKPLAGEGNSISFRDVWADAPNNIYLINDDGDVVRYDGAANAVVAGQPGSAWRVWGWDSGEVFVTHGEEGTVSRFDGTTWSEETTGSEELIHRICGTSPDDLYALNFGQLYHRSGGEWTALENCPANIQHDMDLLPGGGLFVDSDGNPLYTYEDGHWHELPSLIHPGGIAGYFNPFTVCAVGPDELYAGGYTGSPTGGRGMIQHFDGVEWSIDLEADMNIANYGPPRFNDIVYTQDGTVYAFGIVGTAFRKSGVQWDRLDLQTDANLTCAMALDTGEVIVAGWGVLLILE